MERKEIKNIEKDFSFKNYFLPLTSAKAITWIVIICFIIYGNVLINGFVGDDKIYIITYFSSHLISLAKAFGTSVYNTDGQYRPIAVLYFSVLYTLFGTSAFFYHFFQLLLHLSCAILVFVLFRKFFSVTISFFLTLLFLIHPLQVESVAYIAQSDNEIFFLFGIIALLLSLKNIKTVKIYVLIAFFLICSFLTKETGFLFFLLIIFYNLVFAKKELIKYVVIGLVVFALYFFIRIFVGHVGLDTRQLSPIAMASLGGRLITMPAIIFYYVKSFFYPIALSYDQQWVVNSINFNQFYIPLLADILFFLCICLGGLFIYKKKRKNIKLFLFFFFWFLLGLGMVIQIYPLDATVADRWFYFPFVGLLGIIGLYCQAFPSWKADIKKTGIIVIFCIFVLLSVRTIVRNSNYADSITLFSHDVKISDNSNLDENLAYEYLMDGRINNGIFYMQKSVNEAPNASSLYDLGNLYEQSQNYSKAIYYYETSIQHVGKTYGEDEVKTNDYDGIARILTFHEKAGIARNFLENALKIYPNDGSYWAFLAIVDYTTGDQKQAIYAAAKAKVFLNNPSANLLYYRISHKIPLNLKN